MSTDNGHKVEFSTGRVTKEIQKGNDNLLFTVGEHVKVKGSNFIIESFGKKMMVLRGLPGTKLRR